MTDQTTLAPSIPHTLNPGLAVLRPPLMRAII